MIDKETERRSFKRIEIPGAVVRYKVSKGLHALKNFSAEKEIINLSKSGIAFHLKHNLNYGTPIQLKIQFPDGKDLKLTGKIRWQNETNGSGAPTIGVMFNPFGTKKKYNPMHALEYLRSMKELAISQPFDPERSS